MAVPFLYQAKVGAVADVTALKVVDPQAVNVPVIVATGKSMMVRDAVEVTPPQLLMVFVIV